MHVCNSDKNHKHARHEHEIALLKCYRDVNAFEGEHSHINNAFEKRKVGWEFGDNLITERRHGCNANACKRIRCTTQTLNIVIHS